MSYAKNNRRRIDWARLITLILIVVVGIALIVGLVIFILNGRMPASLRNSENKNAKSIKKNEDNYIIAVFYPDDNCLDIVNKEIEAFKIENAEYVAENKSSKKVLHIDYSEYGSGDYSSFEMYKETGLLDDLSNKQYIGSYCKNNTTNKAVTLNDLFEGEYLKQLSAVFRKTIEESKYSEYRDLSKFYHNTKAEYDNFKNFTIEDDNLKIFINNDLLFKENIGVLGIKVDLNKMSYYLQKDINCKNKISKSADDINHLRYIDPDKPMIALTYDDGPNYKVTNTILDTLEEYDSVATFFVVGNRLIDEDKYGPTMVKENVKSLQREYALGMEIGNHTYTHVPLTMRTLDSESCLKEWQQCSDEVSDLLGGYTMKTIRPTGGEVTDSMREAAMCKMVNWSLDTKDWSTHDAAYTSEHILQFVEDGDVILMHDVNAAYGTHTATQYFVPKLVERGYQLVTVTELFEYKGIETVAGEAYKCAIEGKTLSN